MPNLRKDHITLARRTMLDRVAAFGYPARDDDLIAMGAETVRASYGLSDGAALAVALEAFNQAYGISRPV